VVGVDVPEEADDLVEDMAVVKERRADECS